MNILGIMILIWISFALFVWGLPKILDALLNYFGRRNKQLFDRGRYFELLKAMREGRLTIEKGDKK